MPGRPTCLTVVGRKTFSSKVEAIDNELAVKSEQHLKEKKKKGKGKEDKRTVSTSGILIPLQNFLLASAELRITLKLTVVQRKTFQIAKLCCFQYSHTFPPNSIPHERSRSLCRCPVFFINHKMVLKKLNMYYSSGRGLNPVQAEFLLRTL